MDHAGQRTFGGSAARSGVAWQKPTEFDPVWGWLAMSVTHLFRAIIIMAGVMGTFLNRIGAGGTIALFCLGGIFTHQSGADAQVDDGSDPLSPAQVDIAALVGEADVFPDVIDDPVWQIETKTGRSLLRLPLIVETGSQKIELTHASIKIQGGRFIAWQILEDTSLDKDQVNLRSDRRRSPRTRQPIPGYPAGYNELQQRAAGGPVGSRRSSGKRSILNEKFDQAGPRLARKVTIEPSGTIGWSLDRIPGLQVAQVPNLYALRLDSTFLRQQNPALKSRGREGGNSRGVKPPRSKQLGSGRDRLAQRESAAKLRVEKQKQAAEYRQLQKQVRGLGAAFKQEKPVRLWAIYEIPQRLSQLVISGTSQPQWMIKAAFLKDLRQVSQTGFSGPSRKADANQMPSEVLEMVSSMTQMLDTDSHAYSHRAIVATVGRSGLIHHAELGDLVYQLLETVLVDGDQSARLKMIDLLARASPQTTASERLLQIAAHDRNPVIRLAAFRARIVDADVSDPAKLAELIEAANHLLADSPAMAPSELLETLLVAANNEPNAMGQLVRRIRFGSLKAQRLEEAIRFVILHAPGNDLAAAWLDQQLLGSANGQLVRQTLRILDEASSGPPSVVQGYFKSVLTRFLGPAKNLPKTTGPITVELVDPLRVTSSSHSLFRILYSDSPTIYKHAWPALRHFVFSERQESRFRTQGRRGSSDNDIQLDLYAPFIDAALHHQQTPLEAVGFLNRQPDLEQTTVGLVRIAAQGSREASLSACRLLLGSGRPIDMVLSGMTYEDRLGFARAVFQAHRKVVPTVVPLIGEKTTKAGLLAWFGSQVANGILPDASQWAGPAGGEDHLLDLINSDQEGMPLAAVAALVTAAGGSTEAAEEVLAILLKKKVTRTVLLSTWEDQRRVIYIGRLGEVSGPHRIELRVVPGKSRRRGSDPFAGRVEGDNMPAAEAALETFALGTVDLLVNNEKVIFGTSSIEMTIPDEKLALRFANLKDLRQLAEDQELPIAKVRGHVDLLPHADGVWRGKKELRDGRAFELILTPVGG